MELSLSIDQGNSSAKLSVFDGETMLATERHDRITAETIEQLLERFDITCAIYSSVIGNDENIIRLLRKRMRRYYVLDENLPLPLSLGYATPHTLGHDRIAVAAGAVVLKPGRNILIVDLGTAITYDVVTADRTFKGGNIAPGVQTRFSALDHFCVNLPLVGIEGDVPLIGYNTETAIRSGVILGVVAEIRYMADRLSAMYDNLAVMLTGGDCEAIAARLSMGNNVEINNNLVTIGLNRILQYNELL